MSSVKLGSRRSSQNLLSVVSSAEQQGGQDIDGKMNPYAELLGSFAAPCVKIALTVTGHVDNRKGDEEKNKVDEGNQPCH